MLNSGDSMELTLNLAFLSPFLITCVLWILAPSSLFLFATRGRWELICRPKPWLAAIAFHVMQLSLRSFIIELLLDTDKAKHVQLQRVLVIWSLNSYDMRNSILCRKATDNPQRTSRIYSIINAGVWQGRPLPHDKSVDGILHKCFIWML